MTSRTLLGRWLQAQLPMTQSVCGSQPYKKAVLGGDLPPSPCHMVSLDSESQTRFKCKGKVTFGDEVLGPTLLCIYTAYVYFSLLGLEKQLLSCGKDEGVGLGPNEKEGFSVLSVLGEGRQSITSQGAGCNWAGEQGNKLKA